LTSARALEVVEAALDAGINLFDTADVYGGHEKRRVPRPGLGQGALRGLDSHQVRFAQLDEERKGAAPAYVKKALEDSLRRLGTDYVDLYQLHRPDPATPIGDTLGALADLVGEGKVREIGCSNFSAAQLQEAARGAEAGAPRFVSVQNEYSLLRAEPRA
jgi:aryl-alcohol dehydrogenase-like predicted oxidoreductase